MRCLVCLLVGGLEPAEGSRKCGLSAARISKLLAFVDARPHDPFPKYALALEHRNAGDHSQAWQVFERLLAIHPDYTAGYLHGGNALLALGRTDQAAAVWRQGVEVCARQGDHHARGELEAALAGMASSSGNR
jgi:tetratricopeptide (TPR) repeat protein